MTPALVGAAATEQHWPAPGEKVTYLVHVKNAGFARSEKTDFVCMIDGKVVRTAAVPRLAPEEETQIEVAWNWRQGPHDFVARADTKNKMCEMSEKNMHTGKMDKPAVFAGKTGSKGEFPLANREVPKNFTTATGCTLHPNPFGYPDVVGRNGLFLVRAQVGGSWHYAFIDIGRFVVEYARGHTDLATYQIDLKPES